MPLLNVNLRSCWPYKLGAEKPLSPDGNLRNFQCITLGFVIVSAATLNSTYIQRTLDPISTWVSVVGSFTASTRTTSVVELAFWAKFDHVCSTLLVLRVGRRPERASYYSTSDSSDGYTIFVSIVSANFSKSSSFVENLSKLIRTADFSTNERWLS